MEQQTTVATLLLASHLMASGELGEEFGAARAAPCFVAIHAAVNWVRDSYYSHRLQNINEEDIDGIWWTDEVEPRARRMFDAGGVPAVDAFYVVALVAILDDYWTLAPELVAGDRAPALTELRVLARRALGDPETIRASVRDAGTSLARAWRATVDRLVDAHRSQPE